MATIIKGTSSSEKFSPLGKFVWNGSAWVRTSTAGTTKLNDLVNAGAGDDEVDGGDGNDSLNGDAGNDLLIGGGGNDAINGGDGNDVIYGGIAIPNATGSGGDSIRGGNGNDTVYAGDGNDIVDGDAGNDTLYGEDGNDIINGGAGRDLLIGGAGADTLNGGADGDTFVYKAASDSAASAAGAFSSVTGDTIKGFTSTADSTNAALRDKIDLQGIALPPGEQLTFSGNTASAFGVWYMTSGGNTFVNVDVTGDGQADMVIRLDAVETLTVADFIGVAPGAAPLAPVAAAATAPTGGSTTGGGGGSFIFTQTSTSDKSSTINSNTNNFVFNKGSSAPTQQTTSVDGESFTTLDSDHSAVDTDVNIAGVLP